MAPVDNILRVWEQADDIDRREGMCAYERYHRTMARLAQHYGYGMGQTTGAFCALSPNNDYVGNLRSLVTLLQGHKQGKPVESLTVSTYNACKLRAWRCLCGEDFLEFTKGLKTRSFFMNICYPDDLYYVTIDGHMFGVWQGQRVTMKEAAWSRFKYEDIARDFRSAAFRACVRPNQIQAVCWFAWKRIHNVVYNPQLSLFQCDAWGLLLEPEDIKPYDCNTR